MFVFGTTWNNRVTEIEEPIVQVRNDFQQGNEEAPEVANLVVQFFSQHHIACIPGTPKAQRNRLYKTHILVVVRVANCGILLKIMTKTLSSKLQCLYGVLVEGPRQGQQLQPQRKAKKTLGRVPRGLTL